MNAGSHGSREDLRKREAKKGAWTRQRNIMDVRLNVLQPVKKRRRFSRKDLKSNRLCDRRLLLLVGLLSSLSHFSGLSVGPM
jgi:hypothetical protein